MNVAVQRLGALRNVPALGHDLFQSEILWNVWVPHGHGALHSILHRRVGNAGPKADRVGCTSRVWWEAVQRGGRGW